LIQKQGGVTSPKKKRLRLASEEGETRETKRTFEVSSGKRVDPAGKGKREVGAFGKGERWNRNFIYIRENGSYSSYHGEKSASRRVRRDYFYRGGGNPTVERSSASGKNGQRKRGKGPGWLSRSRVVGDVREVDNRRGGVKRPDIW